MSNLPVRNLGAAGVIKDVAPYNLPAPNVLSKGNNIRLDQGIIKAPLAFKTVANAISHNYNVRAIQIIVPATGLDRVILVSDVMNLQEFTQSGGSGTWTDVSVPNYDNASHASFRGSTGATILPITCTTLADVTYINRADGLPYFRLASSGGSAFAELPTSNSYNWQPTWKAGSLRKFQGFLVALDMTEGGVNLPHRVRWSNQALANSAPTSWDASDTTTTAGFNDIVQLTTALIDGVELSNNFMLYSTDQVWLMEFVGGTFVFNFRKVFDDEGIINTGCAVEVNAKHYVFGNKDIYVHDGVSKQSICEGRVKNFIFDNINMANKASCFVHHVVESNEIYFCYNSFDDEAAFLNLDRCNKAAIYNYASNAWVFRDLPNLSCSGYANLSKVESYASAGTANDTYNTIGGGYSDMEDGFMRNSVFGADGNASLGLPFDTFYALDDAEDGKVAYFNETTAAVISTIERQGIDLDEAGAEIRAYKTVSKMYPQMLTFDPSLSMTVKIGSSDLPNATPSYSTTSSFSAETDYKVDSRASGRYLSYSFEVPALKNFEISGFDADIISTSKR